MYRLAKEEDVAKVAKIYENILDNENTAPFTGWIKGIYPTKSTARDAFEKGELYVCEKDGKIIASAKINQEQMPGYSEASWQYEAYGSEIMVLHTLVVDPKESNSGCGKGFVKFYEDFAAKNNCKYLRMDTNEKNLPARTLYKKLGYAEVDIVACDFCGIPNIGLVCLEKKL